MEITALAKKVLDTFQKRGLSASDWPSDIYFPSNVSNIFKTISEYTNKEQFANKTGPVGWEYAVSLLFIYDSIYISKVQSGNYESVSFRHTYNFKPANVDNEKLRLNIQFDDRNYTSKTYNRKDLTADLNHGLIASFHTHPKYYHRADLWQYTFFSGRDISTLLSSRTPMLGLIMGKNLWLACKTESAQIIPSELLSEATRIEVRDGYSAMKDFVGSSLKEFGIVFYEGAVGGKLKRL